MRVSSFFFSHGIFLQKDAQSGVMFVDFTHHHQFQPKLIKYRAAVTPKETTASTTTTKTSLQILVQLLVNYFPLNQSVSSIYSQDVTLYCSQQAPPSQNLSNQNHVWPCVYLKPNIWFMEPFCTSIWHRNRNYLYLDCRAKRLRGKFNIDYYYYCISPLKSIKINILIAE